MATSNSDNQIIITKQNHLATIEAHYTIHQQYQRKELTAKSASTLLTKRPDASCRICGQQPETVSTPFAVLVKELEKLGLITHCIPQTVKFFEDFYSEQDPNKKPKIGIALALSFGYTTKYWKDQQWNPQAIIQTIIEIETATENFKVEKERTNFQSTIDIIEQEL